MTTLRKVEKMIDKVFMAASLLLLATIVVASFLQVFTRYVMNNAIIGTEELCRYCFIWMSMLGSSLCVGMWRHPAVTVIVDFLKPGVRKHFDILANVLIIVVSLILGVYGLQIVEATQRQSSAVLGFPMSYIYTAVPVGCFGMLLHAATNILGIVSGEGFAGSVKGQNDPPTEKEEDK